MRKNELAFSSSGIDFSGSSEKFVEKKLVQKKSYNVETCFMSNGTAANQNFGGKTFSTSLRVNKDILSSNSFPPGGLRI